MLAALPSEVLGQIVFHLCQPSIREDTIPPSSDSARYEWSIPPVDLLCVSRAIDSAIAPRVNPDLYARIFRANFDSKAVHRRMKDDQHRKVRAREMTAELRRRVRALRLLAARMAEGEITGVTVDEIWVVYLLLSENDNKNLDHLLGPTAGFQLHDFLDLYCSQVMLPASLRTTIPPGGIPQCLVVWISWLSSKNRLIPETIQEKVQRDYLLRPFVFAAHAYPLFFAPWTINDLPTRTAFQDRSGGNPFVADLKPKQSGVELEWYGRQLIINPPLLAQAAILGFFDKGYNDEDCDMSDEEDVTPPPPRTLLRSQSHDTDFTRMLKCHDPINGVGMTRKSWRGSYEGVWEGTFSFFDFDAFREVLMGNRRALYEGPYGEQAQVWRIMETYVRIKRDRPKDKGKGKAKAEEKDYTFDDEDEMEVDEVEEVESPKEQHKIPLRGPSVNAGFPDAPRVSRAGLASAQAELATLKETLSQQVTAMEGYEVVPDAELDTMLDDPDEEGGLELLLTGTGHSAWGRFILRGRVRAWDGMASLVKEYAPDSRGKWIYRGYIVAGNTMVGRWRDTFTPEEYVGYEGAFTLSRR